MAQAVVQVAKQKGLKTISVLPYTGGYKSASNALRAGGADVVLAEPFLHTAAFYELLAEMGAPKLALNAEGGQSGANIVRTLASGATCVTYGPLAQESMVVPGELKVDFKEFDMSTWYKGASDADIAACMSEAQSVWGDSPAHVWMEKYDFADFASAVSKASETPRSYRQVVLSMGSW